MAHRLAALDFGTTSICNRSLAHQGWRWGTNNFYNCIFYPFNCLFLAFKSCRIGEYLLRITSCVLSRVLPVCTFTDLHDNLTIEVFQRGFGSVTLYAVDQCFWFLTWFWFWTHKLWFYFIFSLLIFGFWTVSQSYTFEDVTLDWWADAVIQHK